VAAVFAGVPDVVATLGAQRHPVGGDQGAIQDQIRRLLLARGVQRVVQVRCGRGQHIDALMQVAVGSRQRHPMIDRELRKAGRVPKPAQHQHRLFPSGQNAPAASGAAPPPLGSQQSGEVGHHRSSNGQGGTIGDHVEPSGQDLIFANPVLPGAPRPSVINY
jgi:hypothetical protein